MSQEPNQTADDAVVEASTTAEPTRRNWAWRMARASLLFVIVPMVVVVAFFATQQRSLIYQPTVSEVIRVADSQLPDGQVHDVVFTTGDGLELHGWHVLPDGERATSAEECDRLLPAAEWVVLYFPGNAGNRSHRGYDMRDFTSHNMHVFLFDYRGYGENSGSPSEQALVSDAYSIWRYVVEDRGVPPERVVVFGESIGGGPATQLAARLCGDDKPPAALVLIATFSSMTDVASWHYPFLPVRLALLDTFESQSYIADVTCPVLVFHGTRDTIVPIELGRRLFDAAPEASASGIPKQFVDAPSAGHNDIPRGTVRENLGSLLETLEDTASK